MYKSMQFGIWQRGVVKKQGVSLHFMRKKFHMTSVLVDTATIDER